VVDDDAPKIKYQMQVKYVLQKVNSLIFQKAELFAFNSSIVHYVTYTGTKHLRMAHAVPHFQPV